MHGPEKFYVGSMLTSPPYNATNQAHKSRPQLMLTAGGRVVRIRHDPSAGGNKLMVPTEHELKTILYEQVSDVDSMTIYILHRLVGLFPHVGSILIAVVLF